MHAQRVKGIRQASAPRTGGQQRCRARRKVEIRLTGGKSECRARNRWKALRFRAQVDGFVLPLTLSAPFSDNPPVFTTVAVLTPRLAIGVNSAIFSLLNAQMWRDLPGR